MLAASLPFARRIGVGRRRFVQQPAKVDEMGMRRRPFFEFGSLPFSDELIGGHWQARLLVEATIDGAALNASAYPRLQPLDGLAPAPVWAASLPPNNANLVATAI